MQFIFNDETARSNTVEGLKAFDSQSLASQAEKMKKFSFYDACY